MHRRLSRYAWLGAVLPATASAEGVGRPVPLPPDTQLNGRPCPATVSAEGAQLNGRPFPATVSAEGAQLNAPPSFCVLIIDIATTLHKALPRVKGENALWPTLCDGNCLVLLDRSGVVR